MVDHTDLRGARILLVDDMPANLDLLYALLEPEGYKLSMAPNGEVALRIATETEAVPDLILLDVMMPGMDGFEVCRRLKDDERTQAIPVVFVTADGMTESVVTGFEAGGVDYISKPIRNEEVLMRVRTHLRIRHLTRELDGRNCELVDKNRQLEEEIALRKLLKGQVSEMAERQARECGLEALIGRSAAMQGVLEEIVRLQGEDGGALITGEPGTGKELVARAIHLGGKRAGSPFVVVNCAEFPTDVVESLESRTRALSLLCGHVTGAFQGADSAVTA
jgi:DNA-binding NtrC family response regulator